MSLETTRISCFLISRDLVMHLMQFSPHLLLSLLHCSALPAYPTSYLDIQAGLTNPARGPFKAAQMHQWLFQRDPRIIGWGRGDTDPESRVEDGSGYFWMPRVRSSFKDLTFGRDPFKRGPNRRQLFAQTLPIFICLKYNAKTLFQLFNFCHILFMYSILWSSLPINGAIFTHNDKISSVL